MKRLRFKAAPVEKQQVSDFQLVAGPGFQRRSSDATRGGSGIRATGEA